MNSSTQRQVKPEFWTLKSLKMEATTALPIWLKPMITAAFYTNCETHPQLTFTKFCKDCISSFCPDCKSTHENHQTLTVYKASKAVAVRTMDVKESLDSADICDYSINNRNIFFVHKKAQEGRTSKIIGGSYVECEVCRYRLVKSDRRFCSVECKVTAVEKEMRARANGGGGDRVEITDQTDDQETARLEEEEPLVPERPARKRRRKSLVPSRAPFF